MPSSYIFIFKPSEHFNYAMTGEQWFLSNPVPLAEIQSFIKTHQIKKKYQIVKLRLTSEEYIKIQNPDTITLSIGGYIGSKNSLLGAYCREITKDEFLEKNERPDSTSLITFFCLWRREHTPIERLPLELVEHTLGWALAPIIPLEIELLKQHLRFSTSLAIQNNPYWKWPRQSIRLIANEARPLIDLLFQEEESSKIYDKAMVHLTPFEIFHPCARKILSREFSRLGFLDGDVDAFHNFLVRSELGVASSSPTISNWKDIRVSTQNDLLASRINDDDRELENNLAELNRTLAENQTYFSGFENLKDDHLCVAWAEPCKFEPPFTETTQDYINKLITAKIAFCIQLEIDEPPVFVMPLEYLEAFIEEVAKPMLKAEQQPTITI